METKEEMIPYPGPTMVLRTIIDTMLKSDDILVRNQADLAKYELDRLEEAQNELEAFRVFLTEAEIIADMFGYFHVLVGIRTFLAEHPEEK